ncbi:MAG TPA: hypothetical protein QF901_13425 [Gammaproteobacteria bacterium]|nr:hypothetical protein [Gammaproteobacteria bacterium]
MSIMANAVDKKDVDDYLGFSETLLIIMQQHNVKEEQVLYPMADQALGSEIGALFDSMNAI